MIEAIGPNTNPPVDPQAAKLRKVAVQLQGVFMNQLFESMRATVPTDGPIEQGNSDRIFTSMFDEAMSDKASRQMDGKLTDAICRQLALRAKKA